MALWAKAPQVAANWLAYFAATDAIGAWLWWRRDRIRPDPAIQLLLPTIIISGLAAMAALNGLRPDGQGLGSPWRAEVVPFLLIALLMAQFHAMESSAWKSHERSQAEHPA